MRKDKKYYQVLTDGEHGVPVLQSWHHTETEAKSEMTQCNNFWPSSEWWIEEGTDYISTKCRGSECESPETHERQDAYGIFTGHYCDECYEGNNYPYRKDRYDYEGSGERLEDDY